MTMQINGSVGITFPDGTTQTTAAGPGNVASVTAVAPLTSSGGANPAISLTGIVPAANGGTGAASLTGFLFGNGASPATPATAAQLTALLGTVPVDQANNVAGGVAGSVPFQTAAGVTSFLAIAPANSVMISNGTAPAYTAAPTLANTVLSYDGTNLVWSATGTAANLAGGAANQIAFQSGPGATSFAAAPTVAGTALEWNGTNFVWNTAGSGSVNSVSVVGANGFAGTVATPTTTPAITISTSVTGILLGDGTGLSAAVASDITTLLGTTPVDQSTNIVGGTANQIAFQSGPSATSFVAAPTVAGTALEWNGTNFVWNTAGAGTVTSASVATANGFAGTVATPTTTPVITITTGVTGLLKGDGTAISAASASDITTLLGTTPVTTATNLAGGATGSLPYQTAAGTTAFLAPGTTGQTLSISGGVPAWSTPTPAAALTIGAGLDGTSYNTSTAVTIKLADTAVGPGTYGTAISIPRITVDQQGRITAATEVSTVGVEYQGTWNAATNTPTLLPAGLTNQGEYYVTTVAGTNIYGTFAIGDWIISNGVIWEKVNNSQATSVANFAITGIPAGRYLIGGGPSDITGQVGIPGGDITSGVVGAGFGGTGHATYTTGDTLYASAATTLTKLGIGASGFIMTSSGTAPQWTDPSTVVVSRATNVDGGVTGSVLYQSGPGTTAKLPIGTAGQVLTVAGGIPTWAAPSTAGTVTSVAVSGGTTGLTTSGGPITAAGTITLAGTLNVANGGTGAATLTGYVKGTGTTAMTASATIPNTDITGLGTMSTQNANAVAVTGGTINGAVIGGTTPAAITGTTVTATTFVGVSGGTF